jgi:hypothetical protein
VPTPPEIARATDIGQVATAMHLPYPQGEMEHGCSRFGVSACYLILFPLVLVSVLPFAVLLTLWTPFLYLFPSCNEQNGCCRLVVNRFEMITLLPAYYLMQACHPERRGARGAMGERNEETSTV